LLLVGKSLLLMLVKNGLPRVINEIKNKQFRERERVLKVDTIIREEIR